VSARPRPPCHARLSIDPARLSAGGRSSGKEDTMHSGWTRSRACVLALVAALAMAAAPAAAVPSRSFDTNGDGTIDLTIFDTNGDGFFEWPAGTTSLPGRLDFTADDRIAFAGTVTIQTANGLFYADGSQLVTLPGAPLQKLVVTSNRGDIGGRGLLDLAVTGDVNLTAYAFVFLFGPTRVAAGGTILLQSKTAGVDVAQLSPDQVAPGAFALLAGKQLNMIAKGNAASIFIDQARLGSRVVNISTSSSNAMSRIFLFRNNVLVTTNPSRTGLVGTPGNITLTHQKWGIDIRTGSVVDSGANVILKTPYGVNNVCVAGTSAIAAKGGIGTIDTRLVTGTPFVDASSTVTGNVLGKPFVVGPC
jgi:hypothetical protein